MSRYLIVITVFLHAIMPFRIIAEEDTVVSSQFILDAIHPGLKLRMKESDLQALLTPHAVPISVVYPKSQGGVYVELFDKAGKGINLDGLTNDMAKEQCTKASQEIVYRCLDGKLLYVTWRVEKTEQPFPEAVTKFVRHQLETGDARIVRDDSTRSPLLINYEDNVTISTRWQSIKDEHQLDNGGGFVLFIIYIKNLVRVEDLPAVSDLEDQEAYRKLAKEFGVAK